MARIGKTVFISYRRKDISWALAVYQYLAGQKYEIGGKMVHHRGGIAVGGIPDSSQHVRLGIRLHSISPSDFAGLTRKGKRWRE